MASHHATTAITTTMAATTEGTRASAEAALGQVEDWPERGRRIYQAFLTQTLFSQQHVWRIGLHAFPVSEQDTRFFQTLGNHFLAFYRALNQLYFESVKGTQPVWVHRYLDQGKPESLVEYARMRRFRQTLPLVIRPDLIPTESGMIVTELDAVPGGIGITGCLAQTYAVDDPHLIGGAEGMVEGFAQMLRFQKGSRAGCVALVVSDEAEPYRPEMIWLAHRLCEIGLETYCVHPRAITFTEQALVLDTPSGSRPIAVVYRFFELFDLKNIPKSELVMYSAKKDRVVVTPPYKPWLEEKLMFALFHHPLLQPFWERTLGPETYSLLNQLIPRTWVLDPAPLPPIAVIPDLFLDGRAVADWQDLATATQRQRRYVIKPSGFSELAWGSRGVVVGHDLPQAEWAAALHYALESFGTTPYILQEFHKGRLYHVSYFDPQRHTCELLEGRVRLSPYYFVVGDQAQLGGILATVCPKDKKVIHGMRDAILLPCTQQTDLSLS
ncbi:MAG: hypothetical protein D6704_02030 [Nitrospirae bacterium]|nr:MAG: hypothetical protein D6704_02030 [Nitrospirota bacterium]